MSCTATKKTTTTATEKQTYNYKLTTDIKGVPASQATIKIDINKLAQLTEGAKFTQRQGQATAAAERQGDTIIISADCDSLKREVTRLEQLNKKETTNQTTDEKQTGFTLLELIKHFLIGVLTGFILFPIVRYLIKRFRR